MSPNVPLHTINLAQARLQPWRNGGGVTQELLAWPSADHWQCRISVARIDRSGPFSAFSGVQRWFTVLTGAGVALALDGQMKQLKAGDEPLCFDGALAPGCDLLQGPTQDLNLMLQRDAGEGAMLRADPQRPWRCAAPLRALFSLDACELQVDAAAVQQLPAATLAWSEQAAQQTWQLQPRAAAPRAWWLHFRAHNT